VWYEIAQAAMQAVQMVAQQQQQKNATEQAQKQQDLQMRLLWQQQQQNVKQQKDLLKRQLAQSRAAMAAGGAGGLGGSGAALMAGLARQNSEALNDEYASTKLRHQVQFGDGSVAKQNRAADALNMMGQAQQMYGAMQPFFGGGGK
jgi:hypothetical protein